MESTHTHDDWFISGFHQKKRERERERERKREKEGKKRRCLDDDDAVPVRADEAAAGTAQREKLARLAAVTERKKSACVRQ